jgi:nucleoside-diphosphate-sugar epimerase
VPPVLVTGAPGWLGNRLVPELLRAGQEVRCLVLPGIDPAPLGPEVEVVRGDVRDPAAVRAAAEGVEVVIHGVGVVHAKRRARGFYAINSEGTRRALEGAVSAGVRRFLHVSSNSASGFQSERDVLMTEDQLPLPESDYGKSKLQAERHVLAARDAGRLETVILRPCLYYGPGQPARMDRLFGMIEKGTVPVFGDGLALRSMTYVDDVARVLVQCLDKPAATGETFWIADEPPYTTLGALQAMADAIGAELRVRHLPEVLSRLCERVDMAIGDLGGYVQDLHVVGETYRNIGCSIEKAKRVLGFEPNNDLVGGYRRALEHARGEATAVPALAR